MHRLVRHCQHACAHGTPFVWSYNSGVVVEVIQPAPAEDRLGLGDAGADAFLVPHIELDGVRFGARGGRQSLQLGGRVRVPYGGNQ